jgi:sterol 3beta-glucosyltransferase
MLDDDEEESWTFVLGDADTVDAAALESMAKTPAIPGPSSGGRKVMGSKVLGGAVGTGLGLSGVSGPV